MKKIAIISLTVMILPTIASAVVYPRVQITATVNTPLLYAPQLSTSNIPAAPQSDFTYSTTTYFQEVRPAARNVNYDDTYYNLGELYANTCTILAPAGATLSNGIGQFTTDGNYHILSQMPFEQWLGPMLPYGASTTGIALVDITSLGRTRQTPCVMTQTKNYFAPVGYVANSLASSTNQEVMDLIYGTNPTNSTGNIYASVNDNTQSYTRNTSNIMTQDGVDITAIPAVEMNGSSPTTQCMGVLIAPDAMAGAHHCHPGAGAVVYFVDNSNVVSSSTIVATMPATTTIDNGQNDIEVMKLDKPIPSTITPIFFPPSNLFTNRITVWGWNAHMIPAINTNQRRTLRVGIVTESGSDCVQLNVACFGYSYFYGEIPSAYYSTFGNASSTPYQVFNDSWQDTIVGGDSGSAVFMDINHHVALMGTFSTSFNGQAAYRYITDINNSLAALGSPYQVTIVDLTEFPTY